MFRVKPSLGKLVAIGLGASGCMSSMADDVAPAPTPIKHVVVVVKENHTFDNYFGSFPGADGAAQIQTAAGLIAPPHAPDSTLRDLCHSHRCALTDFAGGTMNGWEQVAGAST